MKALDPETGCAVALSAALEAEAVTNWVEVCVDPSLVYSVTEALVLSVTDTEEDALDADDEEYSEDEEDEDGVTDDDAEVDVTVEDDALVAELEVLLADVEEEDVSDVDVGLVEDVSDVCEGLRTVVRPSRTVVSPPRPRTSSDLLFVAVAVPVVEVEVESSSPPRPNREPRPCLCTI